MLRSTSRRHPHTRLAAVLLAIATSHSAARLAGAQVYFVSTTAPTGAGSLSAAITAANAFAGSAYIQISLPFGSTITMTGDIPVITNRFGFSMDGGNATLSGGSTSNTSGFRGLFVGVSPDIANATLLATPTTTYSFTNLKLTNFNARGGTGGGGGAGLGGALFVNAGNVTVGGVSFLNNRAIGGNGGLDVNNGRDHGMQGGGGMGGNGGVNLTSLAGGGGGGFGIGANGTSTPGAAGAAGAFLGAASAGSGQSGPFNGSAVGGAGGAAGGGGGAGALSSTFPVFGGGGGGGGVGGGASGATVAGAGGFGGGGGGIGWRMAHPNSLQTGGAGGFGGGGGNGDVFIRSDAGNGGFGGGGGGASGADGYGLNTPGIGGFGAGNGGPGTSPGNLVMPYGGGGLGAGGAIFVRQGASLTIISSTLSGNSVAGGSGWQSGQAIGSAAFLAGSLSYSVSSGNTITLTESLGGGTDAQISGGFTKSGAGTLILTADNSYIGGTTLSGGALQVGNGGTTGSILGNITNNGALTFNRSDDFALTGTISGTGSLTKLGAGTLTLAGTLTHSGTTTVTAGTLQIGNGGTAGSITSQITNNGALIFNRSDNFTHSAFISGTGSLTKLGAGTLTFGTASSYTGPTLISAGVFELNAFGFMNSTSSITVGNTPGGAAATFRLTGVDRFGNGTVTSTVPVTVAATGTLASSGTYNTLVNLNLAGGTVLLNGGTFPDFPAFGLKGTLDVTGTTPSQILTGTGINNAINIGPTNAPGSLTVNVADVTASSAPDLTVASVLQNNALESGGTNVNGLTKTGPGTLVLSSNNTYTGPTVVSAGTLQIGSGGTTGSVAGPITNNGALVFSRSDNVTVASAISGTGSFTKFGVGTVTLTGANTYGGPTTISAGTLALSGAGSLGGSGAPITLGTGAALNLGGTTQIVGNINSGPAPVSGTITNGTLNLNGNNLYFKSGTLDASLTGSGNSRLWLGGDNAATIFLGGVNTVAFADNNSTIIGNFSLTGEAGIVKLTSPTALGPATIGGNTIEAQLFIGTLDANGQVGITLGNLQLRNGATSRLINSSATPASFDGTISISVQNSEIGGSGTLVLNGEVSGRGFNKTGSGTLILAAANNLSTLSSDRVTLTAGTVQIGNGGTTGSLTANVTNDAALTFNRSDDVAFPGQISGSGSVAQFGAGILTFPNDHTYSGGTTLSAGALQIGNGGTTGSIVGNITNNAALVFNRSNNLTHPGLITGTGTISKLGAGTLTFSPGQTAPYSAASISITAGAVDLTNNELLLRNQTPASVESLLATNALRSSSATTFTHLAVFPNEAAPGVPFYTTFFGTPALATDTLVRLTYTGDTNIDGTLDGKDLSNLIEGLSTGATGWQNGDFNYDGLVNTIDFNLLATGLAANLSALGGPGDWGASGGGIVPEPASLVVLSPLIAMVRRRRAVVST